MAKKTELKHKNSDLDLCDIKFGYAKQKHEMNMKELEYSRESETIKHRHEMERQRIKSSEIRKMQERKAMGRY